MNVFSNNGVRIGVITLVLFLAIPFLFTDRSASNYDGLDPVSISGSPVGISRNPFSKFYNRVGAFYGFKKRAPKNALDGLNAIDKEYARLNPRAKGSLSTNGGDSPSSGGISADIAAKASSSGAASGSAKVDEYVQIGDKIYDVVTDPSGKKYVLTDKGPIDFDTVIAKTLPSEDAENLKKYSKGDRSKDVLLSYSKYANQGYFDNDGSFVFTGPTDTSGNRYGTFSGKDNPSLFGLGGGIDGGGFPPNIWGDEAFDESKTKLSAKYNDTRTRAATIEKARSTVSYNQNQTAQIYAKIVPPTVNFGKPAIEKLTQGKGEAKEGKSFSDQQSADKNNKKQDSQDPCKGKDNCVILDATKNVVNVANTEAGKKMTANLLCGADKKSCSFEGAGPSGFVSDPWAYPKDTNGKPWTAFYSENATAFKKADNNINYRGEESDDKFSDTKAAIQANNNVAQANIVLINGTDPKTQLPIFLGLKDEQGRDYYPAQIIQDLLGNKGKIVSNPAEIASVADLPNTIFITPSKTATAAIKNTDKNKTVVEFDQYSIDPSTLTSLYSGIETSVNQIPVKEQARKAQIAKEEAKKLAEVKSVNKKAGVKPAKS